ncbi:MAG TPA: hypothetical protein VFR39_09070 [Burkholderiales bacterium]|nr:hypothetical protein [Burkholderiales bacterium]
MEQSMHRIDAADAHSAVPSYLRGLALLRYRLLNKGTAFTEQERDALGLRGLRPAHVLSMEEQAERMLTNLRRLPTELDNYVARNALHDRNETQFFRVVCDNLEEIQPIIYTPTVGLACQRFGHTSSDRAGSSSARMIGGASPSCWATGRTRRNSSS